MFFLFKLQVSVGDPCFLWTLTCIYYLFTWNRRGDREIPKSPWISPLPRKALALQTWPALPCPNPPLSRGILQSRWPQSACEPCGGLESSSPSGTQRCPGTQSRAHTQPKPCQPAATAAAAATAAMAGSAAVPSEIQRSRWKLRAEHFLGREKPLHLHSLLWIHSWLVPIKKRG